MMEAPGVRAAGVVERISTGTPNRRLIALFRDAALIVITTDDLRAQYRASRIAQAFEIPSVVPGLFREHGGEVFLGLGRTLPCFECYSRFRPQNAPLRAVAAASHASLAVEQAAVHLALGILDPTSRHAEIITGSRGSLEPRQLFAVESFAGRDGALFRDDRTWGRARVRQRAACPGCRAAHRLARHLERPQPVRREPERVVVNKGGRGPRPKGADG
jgi:hypothetical protein